MAAHGQTAELFGGFVNRQRVASGNFGKNSSTLSVPLNYTDRSKLETYLLSQGYTQAQLNSHTINDLVYATRLKQDPTSI